MNMKIVILERMSVGADVSVDAFNSFGEVKIYEKTSKDEVNERVKDADIVIANKAPLNKETLEGAENLKYICEFATGFDNVDIAYCKEHNIKVSNVVNYSTDAVAQHTFALMFYILERLKHYDEYVKSGEYASQSGFSYYGKTFTELAGKTWGIIGMGNIGQKVARIAEAFGCKVITYSVTGKMKSKEEIDALGLNFEYVSFDELLNKSDFISLHCPLSDITRGLINYEALSKMKKSAILINVARGPVVVDADLVRALDEGLILGAGLDVTSTEPMKDSNPLSKIMDSEKLFITPHMAWASTEARNRCVSETVLNIEAFINGKERNSVWA